jgi:hypothetical protein
MPFFLPMRLLFLFLLFISFNIQAEGSDILYDIVPPRQVMQIFDKNLSDTLQLEDFVIREEKISACIGQYVEKQTKSYAKGVKNNLYDLLNDFERILSRIYGKKLSPSDVSYTEKIEALAKVQCEAYYSLGVLK